MELVPTPEHDMLRFSVREFLSTRAPMAELGWVGLTIPDHLGGAGSTIIDLGVILEEVGRGLTPAPFLSTTVIGSQLVLMAASDDQQARILPAVAKGELRLGLYVRLPDD